MFVHLTQVRYLNFREFNHLANQHSTDTRIVTVAGKYLTFIVDFLIEVKFGHPRLDGTADATVIINQSEEIVVRVRELLREILHCRSHYILNSGAVYSFSNRPEIIFTPLEREMIFLVMLQRIRFLRRDSN